MTFDPVSKPAHYNLGGIECLDAMEASMSETEFDGYLKGNTFKYLWRYRHKGKASQDLAKAMFYLAKLEGRIKAREEKSKAADQSLQEAIANQPNVFLGSTLQHHVISRGGNW